MRNVAMLPLLFILLFFSIFILTGTLSILHDYGIGFDPVRDEADPALPTRVPVLLLSSLPFSAVAAIFLLFPRIRRDPEHRLLSLLMTGGTAFITIIFGVLALIEGFGIDGAIVSGSRREDRTVLLERSIHPVGDAVIFTETVDGSRLGKIVVYRPDGEDRGFSYYNGAEIAGGVLLIPGTEDIEITPRNPLFGPLFDKPPLLDSFFREITVLNADLLRLYEESWRLFLISAAAVVVISMGFSVSARATSWPLVNLLLCVAAFRGVFYLHAVLVSDVIDGFLEAFPPGSIQDMLPAWTYMILGSLLLILDILFPAKSRKGEERDFA